MCAIYDLNLIASVKTVFLSERVRILRKIPVVKPEIDYFVMASRRYIQFPLLLIDI